MPADSLPTCNDCLKNTMGLFADAASNKTQPLNLDYVTAAGQIDRDCGPGFVNTTIPGVGTKGDGGTSAAVKPVWTILSVALPIGVALLVGF